MKAKAWCVLVSLSVVAMFWGGVGLFFYQLLQRLPQ